MTLLLLFPSLPVVVPPTTEEETGVANPEYTVADAISDVNARTRNPGLGSEIMVPWVSYAYNRLYNKLLNVNQQVKEQLFGAYTTIPTLAGIAEYTITDYAPRYHSLIKYEIIYGDADQYLTSGTRIFSIVKAPDTNNYPTSGTPRMYRVGPNFGFLPMPGDGVVNLWYIKRGRQLTATTDIIDIPYQYIYPIIDYVEGKVIARTTEDYATEEVLEKKFEALLESVAMMADGEYSEWDVESIDDGGGDARNPFNSL